MARFATLYEVPIHSAEADVRFAIDRRDKLGLTGPGAAARWTRVQLRLESPAPKESVRSLIRHAERACHAAQSLMQSVPVETWATLNGTPLDAAD